MSGTLFGLGLSQRVDVNGNPDLGWKLFIYAAASSTPVTAYKDIGLTVGLEHPWPIEANSNGMMPSFWLADGSYRARATSADGARTFFDEASILALGASSGSGGGGGGVDATAVFQTGDIIGLLVSGTRSGWVRANARTIGSATSGASERANSDCEALFDFLWNTYSDTLCPVAGGRGANAAADWSANKKIATLDMRGRLFAGLDDMGNSAASRFTGVPFTTGDELTAASIGGENTHTLAQGEIPTGLITFNDASHQHFISNDATVSGSTHTLNNSNSLAAQNAAGADAWNYLLQGSAAASTVGKTSSTATGASITDHAGGGVHNNMPSIATGTFYIKL